MPRSVEPSTAPNLARVPCGIAMTERAARIVDTVIGLDPMSDLPRTGWLLRGVRPCESIADHSYGVAVTVMLLCDALRAAGVEVDGERALRLALVHDVPEAKTGDIPLPQKSPAIDAALLDLEAAIARSLLPDSSLFTEAAASRSRATSACRTSLHASRRRADRRTNTSSARPPDAERSRARRR